MDKESINRALHRLARGYDNMMPYYDKLCSLAQAQEACLQEDAVDGDRLMENVRQRQELIDILEEHNKSQIGIREEVRSALGLEEFTISRLRSLVQGDGLSALETAGANVCVVLDRIRDFDRKNEEALRLRIRETKDSLNRLHQTKAAHKAYRSKPKQRDGVLIDYSK